VTLLVRRVELARPEPGSLCFFAENELRLEASAKGTGALDCLSEDFCLHNLTVPERLGGTGAPKSTVGAVVMIAGVMGSLEGEDLSSSTESETWRKRNKLKRGFVFAWKPGGMLGTGSATEGEAGLRFICSLERACAVFLVTSRLRRSRRSVSLLLP
jgi:hypothetical protein